MKIKKILIEYIIKKIKKINHYLNEKLYFLTSKIENNENLGSYENLSPIKLNEDLYLMEIDRGLFDEDIKNIALSGPYGVGKSSVLRTYIDKRPLYNYLNISLVNFTKKEASNEVGKNNTKLDILSELESNILKQMFYKVKHNKIPYSRYRRIKNLTNRNILSIISGIGILLITGIFLHKPSKIKAILDVKKNDFTNINGLLIIVALVVFIVIFLVFLIGIIKYIKSNLRLNNIKFKNMEMSKFDDKEFIFDKNIDEIVYFFEVTNYDVVVFEDLDRFDNIEIFIKLRELNQLINNSEQIGRKITFIYAIKDEIFKNYKDRTKFFDFIIPVIPIMNSSNSAEKMKEKLKVYMLDKSEEVSKLEKIIDDVSLYIDDLRLATNICNEFKMYKKILENPELDKLFAIIVYKNIYPKDFTRLQFNKGMLADIFNFDKKQNVINRIISDIKQEYINIENKIDEIKNETINDIHELRIIYLEDIFRNIHYGLSINGERYDYNNLIEKIFNEETCKNNERISYNGNYNSFPKNIREILNYDNEDSYYNREELIKLKEEKEINKLKIKLSKLKEKIQEINTYRIQELIQEFGVDNVIVNEDTRKENLLVYLVKNGYIDEMYDSYIVQLKSGSLTKNDVDFIKMIQGQSRPKYEYTVNNRSRVMNSISVNDCKTSSILNYSLLEFMISKKESYKAHYNAVLNKLSDESKESKEFINKFIISNKLGYELLSDIARIWLRIWMYIENESNYEQDIKDKLLIHLIKSLSIEDIVNINEEGILTNTISKRCDFFELTKDIEDKSKLKKLLIELNVKYKKLYGNHSSEVYDNEMIEHIYRNSLYEINKEMIEFIIKYKCGKEQIKDLDTKNYTIIKESKCDNLIEYINNNINTYVENVLLQLSIENETEDAIVDLLNNENILMQNREKIIENQSVLIYDIAEISKELVLKVIQHKKMTTDWYNIAKCFGFNDEINIKDDLIKYIDNQDNIEKLESEDSIDKEHPISKEEIENTSISLISKGIKLDTFKRLLKNIKEVYELYSNSKFETLIQDNIEKLDKDKINVLIEQNIIILNVESYEYIKREYNDYDIHIKLVKNNIKEYIENYNDYNLEYMDLVKLLRSDIVDDDKILIINNVYKNIETTTEDVDNRLNKVVSEYLYDCNQEIDVHVINNIIKMDILDERKALIIAKQVKYLNEDIIRGLLRKIGNGYEYILETGKAPRIRNSRDNQKLCENLEKYGYISKWEQQDEIIKINRRRKVTT